MSKSPPYTCADYRQEMILLSLQKRLQKPDLTEEEQQGLKQKIRELEQSLDM